MRDWLRLCAHTHPHGAWLSLVAVGPWSTAPRTLQLSVNGGEATVLVSAFKPLPYTGLPMELKTAVFGSFDL